MTKWKIKSNKRFLFIKMINDIENINNYSDGIEKKITLTL
jgi:hypothetical protein